jgi:hypothetical protein
VWRRPEERRESTAPNGEKEKLDNYLQARSKEDVPRRIEETGNELFRVLIGDFSDE